MFEVQIVTADFSTAPSKILVIRSSAIGDIVFASPFAAALRRTYPQARIAWLVEPGIDELLRANPHIDELILWPKKEWQSLWKQRRYGTLFKTVRAFGKMLKSHRFNWVIDLQSLLKSGVLAWMTRAPRRIGLGSIEGSQYLMTEVIPKGGDIERISSEYLYAAQQLGLDTKDFIPELYLPQAAQQRAQELLHAYGLEPGKYAVMAPFTTRPQKHWFEDAWQELIMLLKQQHGITSVILGGPDNQEAAERLISQTPGTISLAGKTSITETAALVQSAGLLVGVDTGVTHMAIAFNTPAVILFGSTRPYRNTCRDNAHVIWLGLSCSPCKRRPTCNGAYTCMRDISAEMVLWEVEQVIRHTPLWNEHENSPR
ncbi:Lipopolysaccharide heptosyltransferase 1 [Saezia sanguinis]|uniref:Lipopolysaccharide heptosyltransferase 1 n=1 Tax=Saezia sanguinis TaxID=1965230 RepID=A0A433SGR8_9BURK|nr:glycosyltransferase family 9 protein [Saezia sanguinis]RUS67886.1 Lipopolysaccharide heptosyltransferase 1 [Saezia sanguinis]